MWMKSFTNMSCISTTMLETIISTCKTMPAYLQYGMDLFSIWSCHAPLTDLLGPDPSPIDHPWDILDCLVHDRTPSQLLYFSKWNTSWLNNDNAFHKGVGYSRRLLLSIHKRPTVGIYKGGSHTRYELPYKNL